MGFQSTCLSHRVVSATPPLVAPYYGLSTVRVATPEMVLGLSNRGTPGSVEATFNLTAGPGQYQYFASPKKYGLVRFLDPDSSFYGGWDGANDDPWTVWGPIVLDIEVEGRLYPFYVYRTDHQNLGFCRWITSLDPEYL